MFVLAVAAAIVLLVVVSLVAGHLVTAMLDARTTVAAAAGIVTAPAVTWNGIERRSGVDRRWFQRDDIDANRRVGGRRWTDLPDARRLAA